MALHSHKLRNLTIIDWVASSIDDKRLSNWDVASIFVLKINLNLIGWVNWVGVNITDVNSTIRVCLKLASDGKKLSWLAYNDISNDV
ncbi:hypothetical protein BFG58_15105 [Enterobacter sp. ku-bf2]|nr:hypothetical protein BFG58_15105 [Enterobacter sp. ku-bf2]